MSDKLQYISQGKTAEIQFSNIQKVVDAGCQWIQLRWKNATEKEFLTLGEKVKQYCENYQATFIVNDYCHWANRLDADGVHLGLDDTTINEARLILGENKIIGGTANTFEDVLLRIEQKCDYIGLGPYRFTSTKEKISPVLGLDGYQSIIEKLNAQSKKTQLYAIGGIGLDDISEILKTGVHGIAVSGLLTNNLELKSTIQNINKLLNEYQYI